MGWFSEVFGGGQKPRKLDFVQLLQNGSGAPAQAQPPGATVPAPAQDARTWPLSQTLFHFESADARGKIIRVPWTFGHSFEGLFVSGATGSGKTSGTGRATARAMLRAGYGGLVLCAKADEPDLWERYAQEEGRAGDVIRFGPGRGLGFNFLDYEISRGGVGGGLAMNAVEVLMQMAEVGGGTKNNEDDTWEKAARHALENAMELCRLAGVSITMHRLYEVLSPGVLTALDWLTIPVLQAIAAHSPGFDRFMRQAQPFTWYMVEAATIMLPLFAAGGFYLLLTADTRRRTRMARRQIMLERENAKVREIKDAMDAKEQAGSDQTKAGKSPRPGEATTDAERLKDVFGNQPPEPPEGKKAFSFWRWLLGIR